MSHKDIVIKKIPAWVPPEKNDARVLGMPNIYYAVQSSGMQPRTILGATEWNKMRKLCYFRANYTCEACGEYQGPGKCDCLERGTQVLTKEGWKNIENVTLKDEVAQFNPAGREITFTNPTRTNHKHVDTIVEIGYKNKFRVGYSHEHRILLDHTGGRKGDIREWVIRHPMDVKFAGTYKVPTAGYGRGEEELTAAERIYIAINADGSLTNKASTGYIFNVSISKDRKKKRLAELLAESGLRYKRIKDKRPGMHSYSIWTDRDCKDFWKSFDVEMSSKKAMAFIDELVKWDGWEGERLTRGEKIKGRCWYTTKPDQADFVQAVCVQGGISTSKSVTERKVRVWEFIGRKPSTNCKPQINIEFLNRLGRGTTTMTREEKEYNDEVYCLTVPTHYFVARSKDGYVFITGNCHEVFRTDWVDGSATFIRTVCVCKACHGSIHSGRMLTMYQQGDWRMPKSKLLNTLEHTFKVVHDWNEAHPDQEPILLYSTLVSYLEDPTLKEDMERLFKQYGVKLYGNKKPAEWGKWRMIYNGKEYPTPYKDKDDYIRKIRDQYKVENKKIEDSAKRREKAVADLAKALE